MHTGLRKFRTVVATACGKRSERVLKDVRIGSLGYWANAGIVKGHEHIFRRFLVGAEPCVNDLYGLFLDRVNDGTDAFCCAGGIGRSRASAISVVSMTKVKVPEPSPSRAEVARA